MKNLYFAFIGLSMMAAGCNQSPKTGTIERIAKGNVEYGHVFRVNEVSDIRSLFPLEITEVAGHRVANQIYEGLVKFDQNDLSVVPALAKTWEVSDSATVFTFHLREDVYFHDDPCFPDGKGRKMTASDVAWCVKQLCRSTPANQMFWLIEDRLKGAKEYYEIPETEYKDDMELEGVKVLDEHTVQFHLKYPYAGFLNMLGHNGFFVYPKEAWEMYGEKMRSHTVGTGPFHLKFYKENELAVLERNPNYWKKDEFGNQLPYLDAIEISFIKEKKTELLKFKNQELDMVFTLPIEMYSSVIADLEDAKKGRNISFYPQVEPSLSVHYYAFQHESDIFSEVRVRKAFNYAIDRKAITDYTLQGEGRPGIHGIIPPSFNKYNSNDVKGYTFDPVLARELMAAAGYPGGKGFPKVTLEVASGGSNYEQVAQVVQRMLKENLNIDVDIRVVTMAQQLDNAETGKAIFWRDGWVADYPDPENFLCLFKSNANDLEDDRAYLNSVRYSNPRYDSLYDAARRETDEAKRYGMYQQLDQMAMNDAVVMPIYYEEFTRLLPTYVQNFPQNGMEYRDFTEVWINSSMMENEQIALSAFAQ